MNAAKLQEYFLVSRPPPGVFTAETSSTHKVLRAERFPTGSAKGGAP